MLIYIEDLLYVCTGITDELTMKIHRENFCFVNEIAHENKFLLSIMYA